MKSIMNKKLTRPVAIFVVLVLCFTQFSASALAQVMVIRQPGAVLGNRPVVVSAPAYRYNPPPLYRAPNDFDRALNVLSTVGAIASIASGARNNSYYHHPQPTVVVAPQPAVVVRTQPSPVIVEKQVVVERQVPVVVSADGSYSPKLGASFRIENMQIPGYKFTAARLMSDPLPSSPLYGIGLRKGDVITRLDNNPADSLAELERHEKNTPIRYIKTGTTTVRLANIYIQPGADAYGAGNYYAP